MSIVLVEMVCKLFSGVKLYLAHHALRFFECLSAYNTAALELLNKSLLLVDNKLMVKLQLVPVGQHDVEHVRLNYQFVGLHIPDVAQDCLGATAVRTHNEALYTVLESKPVILI